MTREEAEVYITETFEWVMHQYEIHRADRTMMQKTTEAFDVAIAALRGPQPDPITGLVPCGCGWCGPERIGWFSVQFWVRASTGKRKWMSVTQEYKKQLNYCPMCGRKLEEDNG